MTPEQQQTIIYLIEKRKKRYYQERIQDLKRNFLLSHFQKPKIKKSPPDSSIPHRLNIKGRKVFLWGVNYPFFNYLRGVDIGPLGRGREISPLYPCLPPLKAGESAFDAQQIEAQLSDIEAAGFKVIRWMWGYDGRGFFDFDDRMYCQGLYPLTLKNLETILKITNKHHLYIWAVLLDFRFVSSAFFKSSSRQLPFYKNGSWEPPHDDVLRDDRKRKALINCFAQLAKYLKNRKEILCFEIMNEASNVAYGKDPVTGYELIHKELWDTPETRVWERHRVPLVLMQKFMNEAYGAIKKEDPQRLVLCSSLNNVYYLPGFVGRVKSDFYAAHYNANGWSDYGKVHTVEEIQREILAPWSLKLTKPLVMGEAPATLDRNMPYYLASAYYGGWAGFLPWSWGELIGVFEHPYPLVPRLPHPWPKEIIILKKFAQKHALEISIDP